VNELLSPFEMSSPDISLVICNPQSPSRLDFSPFEIQGFNWIKFLSIHDIELFEIDNGDRPFQHSFPNLLCLSYYFFPLFLDYPNWLRIYSSLLRFLDLGGAVKLKRLRILRLSDPRVEETLECLEKTCCTRNVELSTSSSIGQKRDDWEWDEIVKTYEQ